MSTSSLIQSSQHLFSQAYARGMTVHFSRTRFLVNGWVLRVPLILSTLHEIFRGGRGAVALHHFTSILGVWNRGSLFFSTAFFFAFLALSMRRDSGIRSGTRKYGSGDMEELEQGFSMDYPGRAAAVDISSRFAHGFRH
ncbi:hypothetical protein B0J18DRAFT_102434 [Chaetomium sp. MPI-SDFR-AT-0129]|nr:hypothetical protein B0J18DRAFT_102434 [Chaetomium sp. MPI-SDFR-AT-0129]